jgi:hypothetical protein
MTDPISVAIVAAVAGKAVEVVGEPAREAVTAIVGKVRERFRGRPEERVLAAAEAEPDSSARLDDLTAALRAAMADDPAFGASLRGMWDQARTHATADRGGVVNVFHGQAKNHLSVGEIHGDVTFN